MLLSIIYANNLSSSTTIHDSDFTCTQHTSQMLSYSWIYIKNVFNNNECIKESKDALHSCDQEVGRYCCGRKKTKRESTPSDPQAPEKNMEERLKNAETFMGPAVSKTTMQ